MNCLPTTPNAVVPGNDKAAHTIRLRIAQITIALSTADPSMQFAIDGAMGRFLSDSAEPDVRIRATWRDRPWDPCGEKIFDSGGVWQLYSKHDTYCFHCSSPTAGPLPYKIAVFDPRFTQGEVQLYREYFKSGDLINPLEYPLDELLIVNLLSLGKGVEVHACGLITPTGDGCLFPGFSGAGKSTMARLWEKVPGVTILSDDRIILRRLDGLFWMFGTPWHGEADLSAPVRGRLKEIFFLRRGPRNDLIRKCQSEAAARLFSCSFPTFYNAAGLEFTLAFLEEVTAAIPCYDFFVFPDHRVIEFITSR